MDRRIFLAASATSLIMGGEAQSIPLPRTSQLLFKRWRPRLATLSPGQQQRLADAINAYAPGVAHQHYLHNGAHGFGTWAGDPSIVGFGVPQGRGRAFFSWHHDYLAGLEAFLAQRHMTLPSWAPWEDIPQPFLSRIHGPPHVAPSAFALFSDDVVGFFDDEDYFGIELSNGPHFAVHALCGGDMAFPNRAAFAPIFWPWHAFVDDLHRTWADRRKRYGNHQPPPKYFPFAWENPNGGGAGSHRVKVPFCIGKTLEQARQELGAAGLRVGQTDSSRGGDRIVTQDPLPWVDVAAGRAVSLSTKLSTTISTAAASIWPPRL